MSSFNQVTLVGFVGRDLKVREFPNGNKLASTTIATNEFYLDKKAERQQVTDWHNVIFYNKAAENAQKFVHKGTQIVVTGKLKNRSWDADGKKQWITEVVVDRFSVISGFKDDGKVPTDVNNSHHNQEHQDYEESVGDFFADEKIPF